MGKSLGKMLQQIQELTVLAESTLMSVREPKRALIKRAAARELTDELENKFKKSDLDNDGFLSREEIISYAKSEFGFDCSKDTVSKIWKHLVKDGNSGVGFESLHLVNTSVGIAREIARDKIRKAER